MKKQYSITETPKTKLLTELYKKQCEAMAQNKIGYYHYLLIVEETVIKKFENGKESTNTTK